MPKTLVIDDNDSFRQLCLQVEKDDRQFQFLFAGSDQEALEQLAMVDDLDIAIVAVDRPGISGLELFQQLHGRRIRVPRIVLLDKINFGLIRHSMHQGAADFLTKPVDPDDLTATLIRVHQRTEERRQAWQNETQLSAMRREIDIAREIQNRILPGNFPPLENISIAARLMSAKRMSGDFYNLFIIDPNRTAFVIADVSGKGVPAAFYMAVVSTLLSTLVREGEAPEKCLTQVNQLLCKHRIPGMFVTLFYAILDHRDGWIDYANGGHLPPYLISPGREVRPVTGGEGVVLGVEEGLAYQADRLQLQPGESLLLFTDGLTEAFNSTREQFGNARLISTLEQCIDCTPEMTVDRCIEAVEAFATGADQSDDITLLALKRTT